MGGLVDNECKDCKDLGQGSFDNQCVECGTVLEGSAPNPDTAQCECPEGQIPSVDGTKCEDFDPDFGRCPPGQFLNETSGECQLPTILAPRPPLPIVCEIGQGLLNGICVNCNETGEGSLDNQCVDCGTVLEGSAPNPDTAQCECPPNQIPSVDGTKCEVEPDTGTDPPSCLGGAPWYSVEERQDDEWCNKNCCAPGCEVESGCCSYENGVSTGGSYDGVHEVCWDENPDPQKFPNWYHGCALCPGFDAGSQEKECLEGQGWIDDPKNCVDCNTTLEGSASNAVTGECECSEGQKISEDRTKCEDCQAGEIIEEGKCVPCGPNQYRTFTPPRTCVDCPPYQVPRENKEGCILCKDPQVPSADGSECVLFDPEFGVVPQPGECADGLGFIDGSDDCVDCNTTLEGSASNAVTGECECPPNQIPSVDGTKC